MNNIYSDYIKYMRKFINQYGQKATDRMTLLVKYQFLTHIYNDRLKKINAQEMTENELLEILHQTEAEKIDFLILYTEAYKRALEENDPAYCDISRVL